MKKILAAALGECIHIMGLNNFLELAGTLGFSTYLLGATIPVDELIRALKAENPDLAAISYRLEPQKAEALLKELETRIEAENLGHITYVFGGTKETGEVARRFKFIRQVFDESRTPQEVFDFLNSLVFEAKNYPDNLIERMRSSFPYPLIRHHFGAPDLEATVGGIKVLAESGAIDVISLTMDRNAEEFFFTPELMSEDNTGRQGTGYRKREDLERVYQNSRTGNHPLLRIYCGTRNLLSWAHLQQETIKNCWGAIPIFWYNRLDGRSERGLAEAIRENLAAIRWYGEKKLPLEVNDAYHWALKQAPDAVTVAAAYLGAYNAKKAGIHHYLVTCMFNSGRENTPQMDLAKMLAQLELITELHDRNFTSFRQVSSGMKFFNPDIEIARGQLAAFIANALHLKPAILHLTGSREAHLEANPQEIIRNGKIARGVVEYFLKGQPMVSQDLLVMKRKDQLVKEARQIIEAIRQLSMAADPLTDPETLAQAVKLGILDAPELEGQPEAAGVIQTRHLHGACFTVDAKGEVIPEAKRLEIIAAKNLGTRVMSLMAQYLGKNEEKAPEPPLIDGKSPAPTDPEEN